MITTFIILLVLLAFILTLPIQLYIADKLFRPAHVGVGNLLDYPPGFSWINRPNPNWSVEKRTITLQNERTYEIPLNESGHFVLLYDWEVKFTMDKIKYVLILPALSTTDFASIPKLFQSFISPLSNTVYAAILHDYFYRNPKDPKAKAITRAEADRIFYWCMLARGVWKITAIGMYFAVRIGGGNSYKRR